MKRKAKCAHLNSVWRYFFLSYNMVVMVVIVNIVLTVLLDEFLKAAEVGKQQDLLHEHASDLGLVFQKAKLTKTLDPFMSCLADFTTSSVELWRSRTGKGSSGGRKKGVV